MCEKVAPWFSIPESQSPLGKPGEPEVLLWPSSLQVHCTVSPSWIATDAGENWRRPPGATVTVTVTPLATVEQKARSGAIVTTTAAMRSEEVFIASSSYLAP